MQCNQGCGGSGEDWGGHFAGAAGQLSYWKTTLSNLHYPPSNYAIRNLGLGVGVIEEIFMFWINRKTRRKEPSLLTDN
jgi:hypothetical protein